MSSPSNPEAGKTVFSRRELYNDRWSTYGEGTGIVRLSPILSPNELRKISIFQEFNDKLLTDMSPDISIAEWKPGQTLFEEGSYIDLAFFVVDGQVELFLGRKESETGFGAPIFDPRRTAAAS